MKEAFRKAIEKNPVSPARTQVNTSILRAVWSDSEEARGKELAVLGDKLFRLGAQWYDLKVDSTGFGGLKKEEGIAELRRIWTEKLKVQVIIQRKGERAILLGRLSEGMWLSEGHLSAAYQLLALRMPTPEGEASAASRLFLRGFSDLSGYSESRERELLSYVERRSQNQARIELPQVFLSVSDWLGKETFGIVSVDK